MKILRKIKLFGWPFGLWRLRIWWHELFIRKNEFHKSLNLDIDAYCKMTDDQRLDYMCCLYDRRRAAHERTLD